MNPAPGSCRSQAAGLYLHIPFCSAICPYCDFAVRVGGEAQRAEFVDVLEREIEVAGARWQELAQGVPGAESFDTLYFGGGTPSLLQPDQLERLLATLHRHLPIVSAASLFLEANPEDVTPANLAAWRRLGVAFLNLGVQSFDAEELRFLGRRHTPEEARNAAQAALDAGFPTLSIDLIYGLPGQNAATWQRNLKEALSLAPQHLSCYELEIHQRTPFGKRHARGDLVELPEPKQASLFLLTHRLLAERGMPGYEVSNFASSPAQRSGHNQKYWHHVPYLGLGPAAHSFVGRRRFWNERSLPRWKGKIVAGQTGEAGSEQLSEDDRALETLMLQLRTFEGVHLPTFEQRFGIDLLARRGKEIERLVKDGRIRVEQNHLRPTLEGLVVADALATLLAVEGLETLD